WNLVQRTKRPYAVSLTPAHGAVDGLAFIDNGVFASAGGDGVRVWTVKANKLGGGGPLTIDYTYSVAASDGRLAAGGDKRIYVWNNPPRMRTLPAADSVYAVAFDRRLLLSGGAD